jgi:GNAT superfamily N-acetyltransferase
VAVRRLAAGEWELLRALRLAALADTPSAFASTHAQECDDPPARWRERAQRYAWFVAVAGPDAVGLAAGIPDADPHLVSMWVDPRWRGRRVAALLAGAVFDWALAAGAHRVTLWVADGNDPAIRAYRRLGFVPTGRRQPLPSNPSVGEEQWARDLILRGQRGRGGTDRMRG